MADELGLQHLKRGAGICFGAVRAFVRAAQVLAHRGRKVAREHAVVDALHVDTTAALHGEVEPHARELLLEARDVEAVGVEAGEVGALEEREDLLRALGEGGAVLDDLVGDAVDGGGLLRNRDGGVEEPAARLLGAVGVDLDRGKLDDAVLARRDAGGLDVEYHQRTVKLYRKTHDRRIISYLKC